MLLVLADAELELVPELLKEEEEVRKVLKRIGKDNTLLDNYLMGNSIRKKLPNEAGRIGFPHIAYSFVRLNEESTINDSLKVQYAIHTKQNVIIEQDDFRNVGPGYPDFTDKVEEILSGRPKSMTLLEYLEGNGILGNTAVLHPKGSTGLVVNGELNYVIGGFPEGEFNSNLGNMRKFTIYEHEVTVPAILELLHFRLFRQ